MKKFLTVLLVIAVMFTFSFGSAFAAFEYSATIGDQYFEDIWEDMIEVTADSDTVTMYPNYEVDKTVVAGFKAEVKAMYDEYMEEKAAGYMTTDVELYDIVLNWGAKHVTTTEQAALKDAVAAAQFAADKADALDKFESVPTYSYSTEEITTAVEEHVVAVTGKKAEGKTYKEAAEMLVAAYMDEVEDFDDFNADATYKTYLDAAAKVAKVVARELYAVAYEVKGTVSLTGAYDLADAYTTYSGETATGTKYVKYVNQDAVNNWSAENVTVQGQANAADVAAKKAANAAEYAAYVVGKDAATVKAAAKWLKVADIRVEEKAAVGKIKDTLDNYVARANAIAELEAYAAKWGAEKNAEGELIRDAAKVKEALEDGIAAIATEEDYANALTNAKKDIDAAVSAVVADKLNFVKESAIKATELFLADAAEDEVYFAAEYAKVEAQIAKYVAKIEAAEEYADVKAAIETMQDKIDDIKTADKVRTLCTEGALSATVEDLVEYAGAYVTYYEAGVTKDGAKLDTSTLTARVVEMVGESGLRTVAEVKKLGEEAAAVAQGLPTKDEVKAAKKAVKDAVEAFPVKITVDALAQVQAAYDAQDAYEDMTTADSTYTDEIEAAVADLVTAYNKSFVKAAATVDEADEAAVKALKAEIKAVINTLDALDAENTTYLDNLVKALNGYLSDIQEDEEEAVEDAIAAIPVNVTEADKAVVEKARELYDAYVAKYTNYEALYDEASYTAGYAADDIAIGTLTSAETVLGLNDKSEEIAKMEAIADIEGLKIKANSSAKKGSITVKWTVSEEVEGVKYQVYKSTKAQKGYKKSITTSKTSFKNTKNIKKGTRYYYKVRAIGVVDGVTYYSDWSNKANRIAK